MHQIHKPAFYFLVTLSLQTHLQLIETEFRGHKHLWRGCIAFTHICFFYFALLLTAESSSLWSQAPTEERNLYRTPETVMHKAQPHCLFWQREMTKGHKNAWNLQNHHSTQPYKFLPVWELRPSWHELPSVQFLATRFMAVSLLLAVPNRSWVLLEEVRLLVITNQMNEFPS